MMVRRGFVSRHNRVLGVRHRVARTHCLAQASEAFPELRHTPTGQPHTHTSTPCARALSHRSTLAFGTHTHTHTNDARHATYARLAHLRLLFRLCLILLHLGLQP